MNVKLADLRQIEEAKDIVYFRMEEPAAPAVCRWEMLGYPLMSVLGIRSEDLQNN